MYLSKKELVSHISAKPFRLVSEAADEMGVEAYVIGGYVRDIFLNRPSKDIDIVERIYNFGLAIGNTDMHFGNISFFVKRNLPFELAPIYDMLPMYYAPKSDGTLQNEALASIPPTRESRTMAKEFWQMAIANTSISDSFKLIAQKNIDALS